MNEFCFPTFNVKIKAGFLICIMIFEKRRPGRRQGYDLLFWMILIRVCRWILLVIP